jgi:hypothetical protein
MKNYIYGTEPVALIKRDNTANYDGLVVGFADAQPGIDELCTKSVKLSRENEWGYYLISGDTAVIANELGYYR